MGILGNKGGIILIRHGILLFTENTHLSSLTPTYLTDIPDTDIPTLASYGGFFKGKRRKTVNRKHALRILLLLLGGTGTLWLPNIGSDPRLSADVHRELMVRPLDFHQTDKSCTFLHQSSTPYRIEKSQKGLSLGFLPHYHADMTGWSGRSWGWKKRTRFYGYLEARIMGKNDSTPIVRVSQWMWNLSTPPDHPPQTPLYAYFCSDQNAIYVLDEKKAHTLDSTEAMTASPFIRFDLNAVEQPQ
jgi:hypothetical protein